MKKTQLLNIKLSKLIASLGHGESLVIGDAGLPVPPNVQLIDLALTRGVPGFMRVLETVLSEMCVESHVFSDELLSHNPQIPQQIKNLGIPDRKTTSHENLKRMTCNAKAVIRTGEFSPYTNIILFAGVLF